MLAVSFVIPVGIGIINTHKSGDSRGGRVSIGILSVTAIAAKIEARCKGEEQPLEGLGNGRRVRLDKLVKLWSSTG
jgi:hypothetical protein